MSFFENCTLQESATFDKLVKTLAHEMGHSLGMNGHTEDTKCQKGQYLMSSTLNNKTHPITTLSQCTKNRINVFLNKKFADRKVKSRSFTQEDINNSRLAYCWYRTNVEGVDLLSLRPRYDSLVVSNQLDGNEKQKQNEGIDESIWIIIGCSVGLLAFVAIGIGLLIYDWKTKKRCFACCKKDDTIELIE